MPGDLGAAGQCHKFSSHVQAAQCWPAQFPGGAHQPFQTPNADWWHQLEQLVDASVRAASDGLHGMPSAQDGCQGHAAVGSSGAIQLSAPDAAFPVSSVAFEGQQPSQKPEPQTRAASAPAGCLGSTVGDCKAAGSTGVVYGNAHDAEHLQSLVSDPAPEPTPGSGSPERSQPNHQMLGGVGCGSSCVTADSTSEVFGARSPGSLQQNIHSGLQDDPEDKLEPETAITILLFPAPVQPGNCSSGSSSQCCCSLSAALAAGVGIDAAAGGAARLHRQAGDDLSFSISKYPEPFDPEAFFEKYLEAITFLHRSLPSMDKRFLQDGGHDCDWRCQIFQHLLRITV